MSYTLHNFKDGEILYGEELNEMEEQIAENSQSVRYTDQVLSADQQAQARENIGAASDGEVRAIVAQAVAEKAQLWPAFANSIAECTDTTRLYVLPDGFLYGYMFTASAPPAIVVETATGGYWCKDEVWMGESVLEGKRTNIFPVSPGDRLSYTGTGIWNGYSVYWYDENKAIVDQAQINDGTATPITREVTAPEGARYVRFASLGYLDAGGAKLEVSWVLCQGVETNYMWASTGHAFVPADYEDRITDAVNRAEANALDISALSGQVEQIRESLQRGSSTAITVESREGGYWDKSEQWVATSGGSKRTNRIPVAAGDRFRYTGRGVWNVPSVLWYDAAGTVIANEQYSSADGSTTTATVTAPTGASYARFISYSDVDAASVVLTVTWITTESQLEELKGANYLYGKKYVACGDSFTEGDFTGIGKTAETWDEEFQCYKTYPWWIAKRNGMTLVNEAVCGSTMHDDGSEAAFCRNRYKQIPADADYITLCFGLNELDAEMGSLESEDTGTVMGAWNTVLEYLITQMPFAKIGIIIPDSYCSQEMRDAVISVAKYWGIPWLDTKGDPKVPLLMGGRYGDVALNDTASALRNTAFYISGSNTHPNARAHEYRSTIIENFLRSL